MSVLSNANCFPPETVKLFRARDFTNESDAFCFRLLQRLLTVFCADLQGAYKHRKDYLKILNWKPSSPAMSG
jgi:hypothetical protein